MTALARYERPAGEARNRWIAFSQPSADARLRLFCLPFAGGGAGIYRSWPEFFPADIDVLPVALPGREMRFAERPFERLSTLIPALAQAMEPLLDRPYALFGYSMGALIAHRLALHLSSRGFGEPAHLLVAAHRAPGVPRRGPDLH